MKRFSAFLLGLLAAFSLQVFAAQQIINIGSSANDGTGDTLRTAGQKMNDNFTELYALVAGAADLDGNNTFSGATNVFDPSGGADELTIVNGVVTTGARLDTTASATGGAGLRIPHGTAPTTPTNGDFWTTTTGVFARVNGSTLDLASVNFPLLGSDGSVSAPTYAFSSDSDTGIYRQGSGAIGFTLNNSLVGLMNSTALSYGSLALFADGRITIVDGTATLPGINFSSDTNTGIYSSADEEVAIAVNGSQVARFTSIGCVSGCGASAFTEGTFTVTWDQACSTNPTQTWNYAVSGNVVTIAPTQEVSCTSDSTFFISTANDVPSAIRQNTASVVMLGLVNAVNNGTNRAACLRIESDYSLAVSFAGTDGLCSGTGGNSWTNTGTKGLNMTTNMGPNNFTYLRDRN